MGSLTRLKSLPCPVCRSPAKDEAAARLGFCCRCAEFTGMCAAGRNIRSPEVTQITSWHVPCTTLGTAEWKITYPAGRFVVRLCGVHDAQLRNAPLPWITNAVPLGDWMT